jgi:predicted nucleotide-binding protein
MRRTRVYRDVRFRAETIKAAEQLFHEEARRKPNTFVVPARIIQVSPTDTYELDTDEEFFDLYRGSDGEALYSKSASDLQLQVSYSGRATKVTVQADTREKLLRICEPFENDAPAAAVRVDAPALRVFIGHGHSAAWRELKDHLTDQHGFETSAYEVGARAGHWIRDILESLLTDASFAILVMTAEDQTAANGVRARQNVVHELGLFQGKLGFARAIVVNERGVELFSNIDGLQRVEFGANNIREAFGDVVAALRQFEQDRHV